jgi:uncharacterized membrane protein YhaH (DUF805 family)
MDWKTLFFSADGRIGRKDFWIGWALLIAANLILAFVPGVGQLVHLLSLYVSVCLFSKRLHDFGRTGWLNVIPYGACAVAILIIAITSGVAVIMALTSGEQAGGAAAALGALSVSGAALLLAFIASVLFLLWVGLTPPNAGENRYGPSPVKLVTAL